MASQLPMQNRIKYPLKATFKQDVFRIQYGGGFSQRIAKGFNNLTSNVQITWTALSTAEMQDLHAIIAGAKGVEVFQWGPDHEATGTPRYWSIGDFSYSQIMQGFWEYTASLVLEYDAVS